LVHLVPLLEQVKNPDAFANADGGTLVLGVEDDGTPSGHGYPAEAIGGFLDVPLRRLRPAVRCRSQRLFLDGHEILVIEGPMSLEAVMVEGNGFPYRVGDQVRREAQEAINARKEAYRRVGFEQRFRHEATLDDLDLELVTRFLKGTPLSRRPVAEILAHFGLIQARAVGWAVTNAGLPEPGVEAAHRGAQDRAAAEAGPARPSGGVHQRGLPGAEPSGPRRGVPPDPGVGLAEDCASG
jgi:predicted HTH transcriptional regulator